MARYISSPLSPIEIRDLPAAVTFEDATRPRWRIGGIETKASFVAHRGPTLGYRLTAETTSLWYLPDHEPGLGEDLRTADPLWISGHALARRASLLIHDCQYTTPSTPPAEGGGTRASPTHLPSRNAADAYTRSCSTTTLRTTMPGSARSRSRRNPNGSSWAR